MPAYDHARELNHLAAMGLTGLEVAPSRIWHDTWKGLTPAQVKDYRRTIETAGLKVVGLHSLFFDQPKLGLFKGAHQRTKSLAFLEHLSAVCRDLGGKTLIYGGGRKRDAVSYDDAWHETVHFMNELCNRIANHGTCFCFEPLGPKDSDFINSAYDSIRIVEEINHPALRVQLDAKALVENDEVGKDVFEAAAPYLVHFHANEPGLGVLGKTDMIDHRFLGSMLKAIDYQGYVSIEQREIAENSILGVAQSVEILKAHYS